MFEIVDFELTSIGTVYVMASFNTSHATSY